MCFASRSSELPRGLVLLLFFAFLWPQTRASAQVVSFSGSEVTAVIQEIEDATPYRFLYRDALVSGIRVTFDAERKNLLSGLSDALRDHDLRLQVAPDRKMVFILPLSNTPVHNEALLRGTVSDARTLERLPHATLVWAGPQGPQGVATDDGGRFLIKLDPAQGRMRLIVSFLGYTPDTLMLDASSLPQDISFKLEPRVMLGSEVVVSSPLLASNLDSTWYHLLGASLATPVGEQSVTRALQMLPAVGLTTAVSSGLNVRGSRADGFQILLDGMPIYNQSHLFGMFDAFNPDALQAVDFYYGIAPARFQAPPGGTLSFLTRTGSKRALCARVGMTTTSASGTAEGPIGSGRGSWIVSARRSYLDNVDWFNNDGLVAMGLGVDRENSGTRRIPLDERTLVAGAPSATFFDLHMKFDHESVGGATFQISAYVGGDRTRQDGERIIALNPQRQDPRIRSTVTTSNDWGNAAVSVHYRSVVRPGGYSHTYAGLTRYHSSFRKDDFFYRAPPVGNGAPQLLFAPFLNDNSFTEARLSHESTLSLSPVLGASVGFSGQRIVSKYDELSALRQEFVSDQRTWQLDMFGELTRRGRALTTTAGLRPQYFSAGKYLRLSPRLNFTGRLRSHFSVSAGYTRNYQFVHRLYVENSAGSDIWVLSNDREPPGSVDHITASLLYRGLPLTFQIEGFLKWQDNLRRHETILRPGGIPDGAVLLSPWTHDNEARAKGLEALVSRRFGHLVLTATYALSRVEIRHPDVNNGAFFLADWDRPHQFAAHAVIDLFASLSASFAWNVASGQPNPLVYIYPSEDTRYPTYHRMDAALNIRHSFSHTRLEAFFRVYNLLDARNTWYRTAETVLLGRGNNLRLAFEPTTVYDLGFQPTLGVALSF